tara:strand:- start:2736 stop:3323 length:588 start_codon:yes stop_codon:yes gene_type:complete
MPSNKFFYEGSVVLNNIIDNLDLSGWINRSTSAAVNKGATSIVSSGSFATLVNVGDILMDSLTDRFIGRVKSVSTTTVVFEKPIEISLPANSFVHVYPKFEISKIEIIGNETYILELIPSNTRYIGSSLPDRDTWASKTEEDFGAVSGDGSKVETQALVVGTVIEGRFKRVVIDNTGVAINHAAICYLKATPTIM